MESKYEIVVGLEVHAQLLTRTKLFCNDSTVFGVEANTQVSEISLGYPGTLPFLNKEAITLAIKLGLACNCQIVTENYFARKNYFYPDLPKGYQISQHTTPICKGGYLIALANGEEKKIRLNRIHIEEDAGKSIHDGSTEFTSLDYNRAGMPLLEIVTEPDIRSAEEAMNYVRNLRELVRHLKVCDGNMQEGSLRCDVNISVRTQGDDKLGTKVEIKNLNSIRFIRKAIDSESQRLISLLEAGIPIVQETRGFDEDSQSTYSIRIKEDEDDYRYFPEPDLPPFVITSDQIESIRASLPPSAEENKQQLIRQYGLSEYDASQLISEPQLLNLFHQATSYTSNHKSLVNWIIGPVRSSLQESEDEPVNVVSLALIIDLIDTGKISHGIASNRILPALMKDCNLDLPRFISDNDLYLQNSETVIDQLIDQALNRHANKIAEYRKGKKGLLSLFVGEVMKLSKGKVDARVASEKIVEKLNQGS